MMKHSAMSVAETDEEFNPVQACQESSPNEAQDGCSSFENMQTELHSKGAVLTKAWSDLFSFITKYQAELVVKENSVGIAEKEIEQQKRQLEEMKPVDGGDKENLQDVIRAKERLLNKAQSELGVKDRMLQSLQLDLSSHMELLQQSQCDLLKKQNDLVKYQGNVEQLKSELNIKQEQIQIKDSLLKKLQNQLMKENAELKEQLELERRSLQLEKQSHELTKKTMSSPRQSTRKRARTSAATSGVIEIPDSPPTLELSDDQGFGLSNIVSMAESQTESSEPGRRVSSRLSTSVTSASQPYTDNSSHLRHMPSANAPSQMSFTTPQEDPQFQKTLMIFRSDNMPVSNTAAMTTSDTFFPLSVSEDTKSGIDILTNIKIDTDIEGSVPQPATPSSGTSDNEGPLSVPGPITSPGMSPGGSTDGETDRKVDAIGLDLQCDEGDPNNDVGGGNPVKKKKDSVVCNICGNSYVRRSNLLRHQRIHFGTMKTCDLCQKQFTDSFDLRRHLESKHQGIRYSCPQCPKSFSTKLLLKKHIDCHNEVYRYKCSKCQRGFNHLTAFKTHMDRHNGIKPHLCSSCGKFFTLAGDRDRHYISCAKLHVESYMCNVCGKSFKGIRYFRAHQKFHDDPSSLKCKFCEKTLMFNSSLRKHMKLCKKRPL